MHKPVYLATARKWDDAFEQRIKSHQEDRAKRWYNLEEVADPSKIRLPSNICVIDCVTLWLANLFLDKEQSVDEALKIFKAKTDQLSTVDTSFFNVTNELGMGLHAETAMRRKFTDLQGWTNQYLMQKAAELTMLIGGFPLQTK